MDHQPRPVVYISGPITIGDPEHNFKQAADAQRELMDAGFSVVNPMLTMQLPYADDVAHADWIANDLPIIRRCDALLRLPGESAGADEEVRHAKQWHIPFFKSTAEVIQAKMVCCFRVASRWTTDFAIRRLPGGNAAFQAIVDSIVAMHDKKSKDYGQDEDPLANVRTAEEYAIPAWVGVQIRLDDKRSRIKKAVRQLIAGETITMSNESLEDSLLDRCVYSIIALQLYREWATDKQE